MSAPAAHDKEQGGLDGHGSTTTNGYDAQQGQYHQGFVSNVPGAGPVVHQGTISQVTNPEFFKIANPGPLGLISFAVTTLCLGFYQCGVGLPNADPLGQIGPYQAVFGLAVFYGGAAQALAGLMEFRAGNTFGTTVHVSYGAFWLSFAMFLVPSLGLSDAYGGDMRAYSVHVGIYLMAWAFLTLIFFLGALRTNIAILAVFGLLTLAFFFLSVAQFISTEHVTAAVRVNRTGGAFAIFTAFAAFYAGASGLMTPATTFITLPLGEFGEKAKVEKSKV